MRTGDVIRYATLPGLRPRFGRVFMTGFRLIPYLIAILYNAVRLLPNNHPYLRTINIGRYGVRDVIAQAANQLELKIKNIDQMILFFAIMVGLVLVGLQILLLLIALFVQPAMAFVPSDVFTYFQTQYAEHDIAFMFLDMVFGIEGIFNSCISTATACVDMNGNQIGFFNSDGSVAAGSIGDGMSFFASSSFTAWPYPVHVGLHALFNTYNLALMVVAMIIIIYFAVTIVAETAQTGTPFGKRFNKVWAPLRIVLAIGLLFPIGIGINASQYIVLYSAKFGSGFASNAWIKFNETINAQYGAGVEKFVSSPNLPEIGNLAQFLFVAKTCKIAYEYSDSNIEIEPYFVKDPFAPQNSLILQGGTNSDSVTSYEDVIAFADGDSALMLAFGVRTADGNRSGGGAGLDEGVQQTIIRAADGIYPGFVRPVCGNMMIPLKETRVPGQGDQEMDELGAAISELQRFYIEDLIRDMWYMEDDNGISGSENYPEDFAMIHMNVNADDYEVPGPEFAQTRVDMLEERFQEALEEAVEGMNAADKWDFSSDDNNNPIVIRGWGAGGIWYNRIAEMNGAITSAIFNVPTPNRNPMIMEYVADQRRQYEQNFTSQDRYNPNIAGREVRVPERLMYNTNGAVSPLDIAKALYFAHRYWDEYSSNSHMRATNNILIDLINGLLGTEGVFNMRNNADVHPLAQLTGIGRALVESSVRNIGYAGVGGVASVITRSIQGFQSLGALASTAASFMLTFAMIGLTIGFVLFYIVPFMPFIYFFFAMAGWVKGIFEAMIGAPLWALAHIRIDGEGVTGQAALGGYFLVLEIFLRPVLIVFGFIASVSIFAALVGFLHSSYDLVIENVGGSSPGDIGDADFSPAQLSYYRGAIDEFFFTMVYAVIVYMLGTSCFKLIDDIPNNILRWMGQSVQTFNDQRGDQAESLSSMTTIGAQQTFGGVGKALEGFMR